ncbi:MAG: TetR/AcrR family transcriptional regulator [Pseudomonadota bacterium]
MKKNLILTTAARLFAERGFSNTPTSLLAKEANVAEGTIFRHFKTKDEIFLTLINNVRDQLITDIEKYLEVRAPDTSVEKVISIIKSFYVFVLKNRMEFGLIFRDAPTRYGERNDTVLMAIKEIYDYLGGYIVIAIREGQANGTIRQDLHTEDTTKMLIGTMVGLVRAIHFQFLQPSDDVLRHVVESYTYLLTPKQ